MSVEMPVRGRGVQSVDVSVTVLVALARNRGPMGLTELAQAIGMAPAKAHRYLASFVAAGMVTQRGSSGAYDLGPLAAEIGIAAIARVDPVNSAADRLAGLVEETGLSATLSVWGSHGPTVIRWEKAARPLVTTLGLGTVLPLTRSATGRVFLAHLPDRLVAPVLAAENPDARPDEFAAERREIRRTGLARADAEFIPGLYALAAPIFDAQASPVAVATLVATDRSVLASESPHAAALRTFASHG
ncbi:IclR family transcriptional regulator [Sulfitobacter sp. D35]|uniref:IclR family transcriptional regulator n=1 Tax=Sulfitobacter sp. D35 TaxID=3083252 RepID=UPI00296F2987|nr:IclR family transcriptional regulator [Sulfitobacter sp. D35]MDW4499243.1 IclR family transcriptional regulator [Sulfitobacter sp. D35]